ncbi:MAG TPA: molybdopterin cofactor-binding domain-containing protein [Myxococcaceae bacterium]|jgi:CO/xanthine dehydrogenase Mo-binding subunit
MILQEQLLKVTGGKVYARDLRAADLAGEGWPAETLHACYLRAAHVDRAFVGIDLELLRRIAPGLRKVVTAADLARDRVYNPSRESSSFGRMMVNAGERAEMFGQPVALLLFERQSNAGALLESGEYSQLVRYDAPAPGSPHALPRPALGMQQYPGTFLIRYPRPEGAPPVQPDPDADFSFMKNGRHDPSATGPELDPKQLPVNVQARVVQARIEQDLAKPDWYCLDRTFSTPGADPMFMEPEAGLAWWDPRERTLRLVLGTQSPAKDVSNVEGLWQYAACAFREGGRPRVSLKACPPGGAFGGRDESSFPLYLALAALYAGGPVRLAYSRAEQFLTGIKRHASVVRNRLAYSPDGALQALQSEIIMDGGGEPNLTAPVLGLAVLHAAGPYRIPRTSLHASASITPSAPSGSMRGFGIPQVTFPMECMIDEIASGLGRCPVEYRLGVMLARNDYDVSGMQLTHHLGNAALCRMALAEPLWRGRDAEKARRDRDGGGVRYGVGFACCMEAYGTSQDAGFAGVELSPGGTISTCSSAVDMGQGTGMSLAAATEQALGAPAPQVLLGDMSLFECLRLREMGPKDDPQTDPACTPKLCNSMSASMTAFFHLHTVEQACAVLYQHGLLPAARALWNQPSPVGVHWDGRGNLVADGLAPLPLSALAAELYRSSGVTGARVHAVFRDQFATACFPDLDGDGRRPIDAVAVRRASGPYRPERRASPAYATGLSAKAKRTLYASVGHMLAVQVYLKTGRVQVTDAVTLLDAGDVHHRLLLDGQAHGGLAMGLGMALMEELPAAPDGSDPGWNLHRYRVPRAATMPPPGHLHVRVVPMEEGERGPLRKKGIAEAAMTTVAPALANAIAHATGLRLCRLPFTPDRILEALATRAETP